MYINRGRAFISSEAVISVYLFLLNNAAREIILGEVTAAAMSGSSYHHFVSNVTLTTIHNLRARLSPLPGGGGRVQVWVGVTKPLDVSCPPNGMEMEWKSEKHLQITIMLQTNVHTFRITITTCPLTFTGWVIKFGRKFKCHRHVRVGCWSLLPL